MASNPWHPRVVPFFCWILFLAAAGFLPESLAALQPGIYLVQCVATVWLMWRYRHLTPELTVRFHWLAVPTAVVLVVAWIVLGYATAGELGWRWERVWRGEWAAGTGPNFPYEELGRGPNRFGPELNVEGVVPLHGVQELTAATPWLGWTSMVLRLLGMSLIVPLFEEMFIRSAMLRGLHRARPTWRGLVQFASDVPVVGDTIAGWPAVRAANAQPPALTAQLERTPVGHLTVFAVVASTVVFMASHLPRDWPGCVACGVVWCGLLWWTNRPRAARGETWDTMPAGGRMGLGPIVWSHGLTNALLWGYTLASGDWRFL